MECINIHTKTNSIIKYDWYILSRIFFCFFSFFKVGSHWKNPKAKWSEKSMGCWHCSDAFYQHLLYIWLAVPEKPQRQNSRKSLWVACGHTFLTTLSSGLTCGRLAATGWMLDECRRTSGRRMGQNTLDGSEHWPCRNVSRCLAQVVMVFLFFFSFFLLFFNSKRLVI